MCQTLCLNYYYYYYYLIITNEIPETQKTKWQNSDLNQGLTKPKSPILNHYPVLPNQWE